MNVLFIDDKPEACKNTDHNAVPPLVASDLIFV